MRYPRHTKRSRGRRSAPVALEKLESRRLLASDWQNRENTFDVNRDRRVSALDALLVINEIDRQTVIDEEGSLPSRAFNESRPFWDATGDNRVTALDALRVINAIGRDKDAPVVLASLAHDTSNGPAGEMDRITSDPRLTGTIVDVLGIQSLTVRLDDGPEMDLVIDETGGFEFAPNLLLDGSADGAHVYSLTAQDPNQNEVTTLPLEFILDTMPPDSFTIGLDPADDTGTIGDQTTDISSVRLVGQTEPLAQVELIGASQTAFADALGNFVLDSVSLVEGENLLDVRVTDIAANQTIFGVSFFRTDQTPPVVQLELANDSGLRDQDFVTNVADVRGQVADLSEVIRLEVALGDATSFTDVTDTLQTDGSFLIDQSRFESIAGGPLAEGKITIHMRAEDERGNVSTPVRLTFDLDQTPPILDSLSVIDGATVNPETILAGVLDGTGPGLGQASFRFDDGTDVPIATGSDGSFQRMPFINGVPDGGHQLTITGTDTAGNSTSMSYSVTVDSNATSMRVTHFTPLASTDEVGVTFRPQVFFSKPVDVTTLTEDSFFATFSGQKLPAQIVPAEDGRFAWLFFDNALPSSASIQVHLVGDAIRGIDDEVLDGDGDGNAGGDLVFSFSTVSLQPLAGTSLTGIVLDPGPDMQPHTSDDSPIPGVEVFLLGLENDVYVTDENGRYTIDAVPGGNVKVAINGMTAPAPNGVYFPEMVMDAHMVPGAVNFVMGMEETYLPRLNSSILHTVSASEDSKIIADQDAAPDLTEEQRQHLSVEVPAGSLIAPDGSRLDSGQIGISTVPPELVRDMLPPGILQHTFDITVQAPGISNFSTPAPLTIPNMVGALPGEQINLLSFDHTTGRLVIEGTMTVSADGKFATTDPGTGITHPGWHGGTRTGSRILVGEPIEEGENEPGITASGTSTFFTSGGQESTIVISNNGTPGEDQTASITVDLIGIDAFAPGLGSSQRFDLPPGESVTLVLQADDINFEDVERFNENGIDGEIYSGRVEITAGGLDVNGEDFEEFFYGRFFGAYSEANHSGIPFEPTITGAKRDKTIDLVGHGEVAFEYEVNVGSDHLTDSVSADTLMLSFSPDVPASQQELPWEISGNLNVKDPDGNVFGQIPLPATYRPTTQVFINEDDIAAVLDRLAGRLIVDNASIVDDPFEQQAVVQGVADRIRQLLGPFGGSIEYVDTFGPNTISLNWGSSLEVNSTEDLSDSNHGDGFCDTGQTIDLDGETVPMCTLRAAIEESNALTGGQNRITFGIPESDSGFNDGIYTIVPQVALPVIINPVILDATTQFGADTSPVVEVAGHQAGDGVHGLVLQGSDATISGLIINRFDGHGVVIEGESAFGNHLISNWIGTDFAGTASSGNLGNGVVIRNGATDNLIGTDADGADDPEEGNVISGNRLGGVLIQGEQTRDNIISGNYIGLDVSGEIPLPNGLQGTFDSVDSGFFSSAVIEITDEAFDGGDLTGRQLNILSGLSGGTSRRILSHDGNTISIESLETNPFASNPTELRGKDTNPVAGDAYVIDGFGVLIEDGTANLVGGSERGQGNHIAYNLTAGVAVTARAANAENIAEEIENGVGRNNAIVGNSIHGNQTIGIDLGHDGFNTNDNYPFDDKAKLLASDVDEGANHLLNSPELGIRENQVEGTLHTELRGRQFRIEFFRSTYDTGEDPQNPTVPHPFETLHGEEFLDAITVVTDANGYASFQAPASVTVPAELTIPNASGEVTYITATATELDAVGGFLSTSEFSSPAREREAGVTAVVHGFQIDGDGNSLRFMAQQVFNLTGGVLLDYDEPKAPTNFFDVPPPTFAERILGSEFITRTEVKPVGTTSTSPRDQERILTFDWGSESNNDSEGWGEHAGDALFAMMVGLDLLNPASPMSNPKYHFIAHSMGTAVTSEVVERMAAYNVPVDHVTLLDPHEFDQDPLPIDGRANLFELGLPQFDIVPNFEGDNGYGATAWTNVDFLDVYYETRGRSDGAQPIPASSRLREIALELIAAQAVPLGRPIPGAYNRLVGDGDELPIQTNQPYSASPGGLGGDHSYVHNVFYVGTVRSALPQLFVDGRNEPIPDLQRPENREVEREFPTTGYAFSRNAIFPTTRPDPVFFQNDEEPQDHVRTSDAFVDSAGNPNLSGLQAVNSVFDFHSDEADLAEAFTEARFDPQVDRLSIFNGDFEIGDNRGPASSLFNGDEVPGWNFQGGGGISSGDIELSGDNHYLELDAGDTATHNLFYVPPANDLKLSFDLALPSGFLFSSDPGSVEIVLGNHFLGSFDVADIEERFVNHTVTVPAELINGSHVLMFEAIDEDAWIDNIRFTGTFSPTGEGESSVAGIESNQSELLNATETAEGENGFTELVVGPVGPLGDSKPSPPFVDPDVTGDGVDNADALSDLVQDSRNIVSDAALRYLFAQSVNQSLRSNVAIYVDAHLDPEKEMTADQLVNALAATAVHEIAHTLGAVDTGVLLGRNANGDPFFGSTLDGNVPSDIMVAALVDLEGDLSFQVGLSTEIVKVGLAGNWTKEDADTAIDVVAEHMEVNGGDSFSSTSHSNPRGGVEIRQDATPLLLDDSSKLVRGAVELGDVLVDGAGTDSSTTSLTLSNLGRDALVIQSVEVIDPTGSFSVAPIPTGTRVEGSGADSRSGVPIEVKFDPSLVTGRVDGQVRVTFDTTSEPLLVNVSGNGISPVGDLRVEIANNNVGGQGVDEGAKTTSFGVLRNVGSDDLNIFGIEGDARNGDQFTLAGLPFQPTLANPIVIPPGGEVPFEMVFDPDSPGLKAGTFQLITDDPDGMGETFTVVGTGVDGSVPQSGDNYIAYEDPYGGPTSTLRTRSDAGGNFELFVAADQFFRVIAFDPSTGLVSEHLDVTRPSGQTTPVTNNNYRPSGSPDTDGDGLPDDVEKAIGTDPNRVDTNGDGISDFEHIQSGLDPLSGLVSDAGAIGSVSLLGESLAVVVDSPNQNGEERFAYVATGSHGLGIVDVTDPFEPIVLGNTDLSGNAQGVAVDPRLGRAVVAAGDAGVHFVNVQNPTLPQLLSTNFDLAGARFVSPFEGTAFVSAGQTLFAIDLVTFQVTDSFVLGGGTITGMSREGSTLYVHDASKTIHSIDVTGGEINPLGSITLADGGGQLFVGGGVAYATVPGTQAGGFTTVDVTDPAAPTLLGRSNQQAGVALGRTDIAANGSGSAILIGDLTGVGGGFALDIFDVSDPSTTTQLTGSVPLSNEPLDLVLADGLAFVAGGTSGLQIINYLNLDNQGEPPTVTLSTPFEDVNPATDGLQVFEGSRIPLSVNVNDDVQVRSVELLQNGNLITVDGAFPYDFSTDAPDTPGAPFELKVRATDTGGNVGLSNTLILDVIPDNTPPQIDLVTPANGSVLGQGFQTIEIDFSKRMSSSAGLVSNYVLARGIDVIDPIDVQLRNNRQTAVLFFDPFSAGSYQLTVDSSQIADTAGNSLGVDPFVSTFTVAEFTSRWIGTDGFWDDPGNWSTGQVPGENDFVLIDVPGDHTITHRSPDTKVAGIFSQERFFQQTGSFTITGDGRFQALELPSGTFVSDTNLSVENLTLSGTLAEFRVNTRADLTGDSIITAGRVTGVGEIFNQGRLTINGNSTLRSKLTNESEIAVQSGQWTFSPEGVLKNLNGAVVDFQSDAGIREALEGPGKIENEGRVVKSSGTGTSGIVAEFNNRSQVDVASGTLSLFRGGHLANGNFVMNQDATLDVAFGAFTLDKENRFSGSGEVVFRSSAGAGGGVTILENAAAFFDMPDGGFNLGGTTDVQGTLTNLGSVLFAGALLTGDGTLINRGQMEIGNNGQLASTLVNESVIVQTGTGNLMFNPGAVLINQLGGIYEFQTRGGITANPIDPTPVFENRGTLKKTDDSDSFISVPAIIAGDVTVEGGGGLAFRRDTDFPNVELSLANLSRLVLESGRHEFSGTSAVSGDGSLEIRGSTTVDIMDPTTVNLPEGGFLINGGTTNANANLVLDGVSRWSNGTLSGNILNRGTFEIISNSFHRFLNAVFTNEGNVIQSGSRLDFFDSVVENAANGSYVVTNDVNLSTSFGSTQHEFNNAGGFTKNGGGGTSIIAVDFNNVGNAEFQMGSVNFSKDYIQTAGTTQLNGGNLGGFQDYLISGGLLEGDGEIQGDLVLGGELRPGGAGEAGTLSVTGTYQQTSAGTIQVELGGSAAGEFDQLVTGSGVGNQTATLGGTLNVSLINGFLPQLNDAFDVLLYDEVVGEHETKTGLDVSGPNVLQDELTDDALTLTASQPILLAATVISDPIGGNPLDSSAVEQTLGAVIDQWVSAGLSSEAAQRLSTTRVEISELAGNALAIAGGDRIVLDRDAGGRGWFIDESPGNDTEFERREGLDALFATAGSQAAEKVDLLSVLRHELAHLLGATHVDQPGHLLSEQIELGTRLAMPQETLDRLWANLG